MKKLLSKILLPILIITLILFLILILSKNIDLVNHYYNSFSFWLFPENNDRNGELFKIILSVLGALGILFGLYVSLRRAKAIEDGVKIQSKAINIQSSQIELSRKAQIDERFKNAVEHLGSEKEPIILGGIAELHQIAKENKSEYSEIIFNILSSYIRSNSKLENNRTIIQTIVNYLFSKKTQNPYSNFKADLKKTKLIGIDLSNKNLSSIDFSNSSMSELINSDLTNSNLSNTVFFFSTIDNVNFSNCKLYKTLFIGGRIKNCVLNIENEVPTANFINLEIENVNFDHCNIHDWNFIATDISNCSFNNTEILYTKFCLSNFVDVNFLNVNLFSKNDFRASFFSNVKMKNITIMNSIFNGCRANESFNFIFRNDISKLIQFDTSLDGIDMINCSLFQCTQEKLKQEDIDEILNYYDTYEKKVLPDKKPAGNTS